MKGELSFNIINELLLRFWTVDPLGQPTVTGGRDNCFYTCCPSVRPSVFVPSFQNLAKPYKYQIKTMFSTGEAVGLAEWITDDSCLVDPLGQSTVTAGRDRTYRPSVRASVPTFQIKQNRTKKTMFAIGETVGLAEWIIDDTCLVVIYFWMNSRAPLFPIIGSSG